MELCRDVSTFVYPNVQPCMKLSITITCLYTHSIRIRNGPYLIKTQFTWMIQTVCTNSRMAAKEEKMKTQYSSIQQGITWLVTLCSKSLILVLHL